MATCVECWGRGYVVVCWDDLCANSDECMHGDGEMACRACDGEGGDEDDDYIEDEYDDEETAR